MKSLKIATLATAVAVLPLTGYADLKPLEDTHMGNITGQAGVTIELETKVTMDEFIYTDEGSLSVKDIFIGGANRTNMFEEFDDPAIRPLLFGESSDLIDNIKVEIDILDDGDAQINVFPLVAAPIDFSIRTGDWTLQGHTDSTLIADNLSIDGVLTEMKINVDTETDVLNLQTLFAIDDMDMDIPFLAMGIRDLRLTGANYDPDNPLITQLGAKLDMDVYNGSNAAGDSSLAVDINTFEADMQVGQVLVGGTSIGSIALDNLSVQNTAMRIYGH